MVLTHLGLFFIVHLLSFWKNFLPVFLDLGESGLGKSTLINSLFLTDLYPERYIPGAAGIHPHTCRNGGNVSTSENMTLLRLGLF